MLGLPLWAWGVLHSWLPYRLAGSFVRRRSRRGDRTTVAWFGLAGGALYFPLAWALEAVLVARLAGGAWAAAFLVTAPPTALAARRIGLELAGLAVRVRDRVLVGRRPRLAQALRAERDRLREEVDGWRALHGRGPAGP
jgi:hypothetical protein